MSGDLAIVTEGLVKDYGDGAGLHGVDLAVPRGGVYGLVGPNGAGKTTLLSILAGLRRADSGRADISVDGPVAICPDAPEFEPWLTGEEVVRQSRGLARRHGPESAAELLAMVGLADQARRRVGGFSRGQTQRLGIAVALAIDPPLLILDEPASALDPAGRAEQLELISHIGTTRTVLFSSHILDDVQRVADTVAVLHRGRLLFQGPVGALVDRFVRPLWEIRVRGDADALAAQLRSQPWVTDATAGAGSVKLTATSTEAAERELAAALAAAQVRLISLTPLDADLESAFLTLTKERV
ncbi:ABC transporter ATP-binding protein [Nonomuraea sp. NPDC052116]|uniref:ABC transporter ATP-binding protein n=1 Tax=Nonomuraea sp. NPDC052116 TaxID=3155665 RepID=UPI00343AD416